MGALLLAVHLVGAALWVGGMGYAIMVLRPSLPVIEPAARAALLVEAHRRFLRIVWAMMPLVLLSGYGLMFWVLGGFRGVGWAVHVMHTVGLVMGGLFLVIWFGPFQAMRRAMAAGELPAAMAANERLRKLIGINFSLGVVALALGGFARFGA